MGVSQHGGKLRAFHSNRRVGGLWSSASVLDKQSGKDQVFGHHMSKILG